jgi:hypothetical protein
MKKVWEWLRCNWKWLLLLPITAAGVVLAFLLGKRRPEIPDHVEEVGEAGEHAVDDVIDAGDRKQSAYEELSAKNSARLEQMSNEQRAEYEALRDAPNDKVVDWFNNLR